MKTDNYKWWEEVQSKLHQQFNDIRLSPEHIFWLSENFNRTALSGVGEEEKELDKRLIHINATPEFMANPKNIKLINDMVEKAGEVVIKKYDPIELKNLKNPE